MLIKPVTPTTAVTRQDDVLSVWNLTNRDNVVRAPQWSFVARVGFVEALGITPQNGSLPYLI